MARVFLSVGSNLGDRLEHLRRAVAELRAIPEVDFLDASALYRTEPWEQRPGQQPDEDTWFFNCVVSIETTLGPVDLLERLQELERSLGRQRGAGTPEDQRYEPRPLDIDILLYGDLVISGPDQLHIPHLLMHERRFVLQPLAELAPDIEHPVLYQTIRELLEELEDEHRIVDLDLPRRWFER
ncbi:MAG TPA: 2-amino-4-hydroxy-6-hydroxymethyldihydropteridine diphosphokinase [Methylomirabilota bacterium]|jgi:2-amino-4-hydroxy-6-hydroxymethyldihydropteridine diphosphokinase|nr:2-amino-4-hydroxy-6-hydroxymethyldihydropteridine diphosphokinase [Methylomirabilota bacterium]